MIVRWPHMLTAWHCACHRVHFVRWYFSSSLPFPWGSQGNVCVFVALEWFSLLDFFFYLQKVRNMALDDVVILNVDTNTLETPFDDLQSLPNDVVGNELLSSDSWELHMFMWPWTCLWGGEGVETAAVFLWPMNHCWFLLWPLGPLSQLGKLGSGSLF